MCPSGTTLSGERKTVDVRSAFDVLDADRDGRISKEDLQMFYSGFSGGGGVDDDDEAIRSMMSVADVNKDGFVEFEEFQRVLSGGDGVKGEKKKMSDGAAAARGGGGGGVMEDVFKVMDKDGDGKLSHLDLKSYMQWAGFDDITDDDIKAMIKLCGGGDGGDQSCVSYHDLLKILALEFVC